MRKLVAAGLVGFAAVLANGVAPAQAGMKCNKEDQSELDDVIKEHATTAGAVVTDEGTFVRIVTMVENDEEDRLDRLVTLYTKPGHPNHPSVVQRMMSDSRRFYMTTNKGWTLASVDACTAMLKELVADEGSNDVDRVLLYAKGR